MFSPAAKTTKTIPAVEQKTAGNSFFRKAGEETFFGNTRQPSFFGSPIQAKLTVSTPDDPQEKEADAVADKVMKMQEPVVASPLPDKKQEELQKKEEEELQPKEEISLSHKIQCKEEPGEKLHPTSNACNCGAKEDHTDQETGGGAEAGDGHATGGKNISLYPSDIKRQSGRGPPPTSISFGQTLSSSKGGGSVLPADTKDFMESRFDADFSGVRIHTGPTAETLSRSVNAQAFAHGNDIYFNTGRYSPDTTDGKTLIAHELTHTLQQGASKSHDTSNKASQVNRKPAAGRPPQRSPAQLLPVIQRTCAACEHDDKLQKQHLFESNNGSPENDLIQLKCAACGHNDKLPTRPLFESTNGSGENDLIQLKCDGCEKVGKDEIQLKTIPGSTTPESLNDESRLNDLNGSARTIRPPGKESVREANKNDKRAEQSATEKAGLVLPVINNDKQNIAERGSPGTAIPGVAKEQTDPLQLPANNQKVSAADTSAIPSPVAAEQANSQAVQPANNDKDRPQKGTPAAGVQPNLASGARPGEPNAISIPRAEGGSQQAQPAARNGATGAGNGPATAINTSSPAALLHSLGAASYSGFAQAVTAASAAVPQLHQGQKDQLAQDLPRIPKPTGLPAAPRNAASAPTVPQANASSLQVTPSGDGAVQQEQTALPATEPFSAGHAPVSVAEPASGDEDSGSWWSWLTSRISSFIGTLPTSDSGVSTNAGDRPQVNLNGEADPQQNQARRQIADGDVTTGVSEGNSSTQNDFGEHNIYPSVVPEEISPAVQPAAASARPREVQQYPVPPYARMPYDQAVQPLLANAVNEKGATYDLQQEQYQQQSLQARQEGLANIDQENLRTQGLQQQIQLSAQGEVNAERQRWRQENARVQETYADQSEARQVEVSTQIQARAQSAEQDADTRLADAEREAESRKQTAEADAQQRKQEAENRPHSWWESFKGAISSAFNAIRSAINAVFDALREAVRTIIRVARAAVDAIINVARNAIIGFIRAFGDALKVLVDIALAQFPEIAQRARDFIDDQVNRAVDAVTEAADALKQAAGGILDFIGDTLDGLLSGLQDTFNEYMDWIADVARGLVNIIENGITIGLPDMTLFDQIAGNWDLPKLTTGDIPLWEARIEDPDDPCIFIAANVFVRADMESSLSASLGPGTLSEILIRLNPFASFYQGSARLKIPASGSVTMVLTGVIGGKAFYTCGDIVRIEGGLEGTGTAGLDATFTAQPTLTYDNGDISFTASPSLETCIPLSFSLDAIARASLLDKYEWNGRWHLFDKQWSKCWNLPGAGSASGSLPGGGAGMFGGGGFGGGGAGRSFGAIAQGITFNPEPLNLREILPEIMGAGPDDNLFKAARKGICDEVDEDGKKKNPCEDAASHTSASKCSDLPEAYKYKSYREAENELKRRAGIPPNKQLTRRQKRATGGPCPNVGWHYQVFDGRTVVGAIGSCPCTMEDSTGREIKVERFAVLNPYPASSVGPNAANCRPVEPSGSPNVTNPASDNSCLPDINSDLVWDVVEVNPDNWGVCVTDFILKGQINISPWRSAPSSMTVPNTANPVNGGNINNTAGSQNHWQFSIDDMADYDTSGSGGAGRFWHSTDASEAHEWAHWNQDYKNDTVKGTLGGNWPKVNQDLNALIEPKSSSPTSAIARTALQAKIDPIMRLYKKNAASRWNTGIAPKDKPGGGGNGYRAGMAVLNRIIGRVRAFKDSNGW